MLDERFVESLTFVGFLRHHGALSEQDDQLGGMALGFRGHQQRGRRWSGQGPQEFAEEVHQLAFAIAPGAMANKQHLFFRAAGQAIAHRPLHEADEVGIARKDIVQEPQPHRTRGIRVIRNVGVMRQQVVAVVGSERAGCEVYRAVMGVQQKRVTA